MADSVLQSVALNHDKNPLKNPTGWWYAMSAHCLVNAGAVAAATGSIYLGVCEFGVHYITDIAKCLGFINRNVDQSIHIGCKLLWAACVYVGATK